MKLNERLPRAFTEELAALVDRSDRLYARRDDDGEVIIHGLAGNDNIRLIAS